MYIFICNFSYIFILPFTNNVKQDTKIAFLCLPGLDNFLKDIVETFSLGYDVKLVVTTDGNQIAEAIKWADIVWLEWANEMAVFATNKIPEIQNKKVVCRLHGYEAFNENVLNKINWKFIDRMVFVADHVREDAFESCSKIKNIPYTMVYNGIDLDKITYNRRTKGRKICFSGYINYKKNPMLMLQILSKLLRIDPEYKVYWVGKHQDIRIAKYMNYILKDLKIEDNFVFEGWTSNIDSWLEDKNYFLSTSIHEGYGVAIMEAMAKGIKPIIHNFYAARGYYPDELIYNTIDEAVEKITEKSYDSESYRKFIEDNYSLEEQIESFNHLLIDNLSYKENSSSHKNKINNEYYEILKECALILSKQYYFEGIDDFTVVIPHYNRADILIKDLENGYKFGNQRKIIIDDCSNNENIEKIRQLEKRKENYNIEMIYYNEKNKRIAETRRIGANLVKTKYLMYLADDDMLVCLNEKKFQEDFRKYTNFRDKYYSMMARFVIGFEASTKLWVQYDRKTFANLSPNETLVYLLNGEMKAGFATQIISTDFMRKYSPESIFYNSEDYVSWCRLLAKSNKESKMLVSENYLHIRRISENTLSGTISKEKLSLHFLSLLICGYYCLEKNLVSRKEFFKYLTDRINLINSNYGFGKEYEKLLNDYLNKKIDLQEFININNKYYIKSLTTENVPFEIKNILNYM